MAVNVGPAEATGPIVPLEHFEFQQSSTAEPERADGGIARWPVTETKLSHCSLHRENEHDCACSDMAISATGTALTTRGA